MASRIRRKPLLTYKSPSADDHVFITLSLSPSTSKAPTPITKERPPSRSNQIQKEDVIRTAGSHQYPISPSLPLFDPRGRLAMSLPPLDPTKYGLPVPPVPSVIQESKSSSRLRRPAAKLREIEEAATILPTVSTVAAVAAREAKERPSPRKRRGGGGKRKRKDMDDGDATYPAKRTRIPRGNVSQNVEEELPMEVAQFDAPAMMEGFSDLPETAKRRSTRAKGSLKRRDSSASETTSVSGSANATYASLAGTDTNASSTAGPQLADAGILAERDAKEEREEGELSEEQPNP